MVVRAGGAYTYYIIHSVYPMKYRVKKGCELLYPDGSFRGDVGYVIDSMTERQTLTDQGDVLERCRDRQAVVSPRDESRMVVEAAKPKAAKKKTTKKKATKKKA